MLALALLVSININDPAEAKLAELSARRGQFDATYFSRKEEHLNPVENAGTNGLGNPGKEWFFPAGSGEYRLWIINYGDSGALVCQSWHGKRTTTDWVLTLKKGKPKNVGKGTVRKLLARFDRVVIGKLSSSQAKLLSKDLPLIGMTEGRGPYQGEIFTWFVNKDGTSGKGYYHCIPDPINYGDGSTSIDMSRVTGSPPILPEESEFLGFKNQPFWHGPGKFKAEFGTEFKF